MQLKIECLFYTDDVNILGKSMHIIAAEKHRSFISCQYGDWDQDLIVSIAIHYRLDGPVIETQWGRNLMWCPEWSWCPHGLLYSGQGNSFPGVVSWCCLAGCCLKVNTGYFSLLLQHTLTVKTQNMLNAETTSYTLDMCFVSTQPFLVLSHNN